MTNDDPNDDLTPEDPTAREALPTDEGTPAGANVLAEDDRRCQSRRDNRDSVLIKVVESELEAIVENDSERGLFLVLDRPLQIEIESEGEVGVPSRRGILVRSQSLPGGKSGWGIQFEPQSEDD